MASREHYADALVNHMARVVVRVIHQELEKLGELEWGGSPSQLRSQVKEVVSRAATRVIFDILVHMDERNEISAGNEKCRVALCLHAKAIECGDDLHERFMDAVERAG